MAGRGGPGRLQVLDEFSGGGGSSKAAQPARLTPFSLGGTSAGMVGQEAEYSAAQSWCKQLVADGDRQLHERSALYQLLRGSEYKKTDRTSMICNQSREYISRIFPAERMMGGGGGAAPAAAGGRPPNSELARAAQYLYERVLHRLLLDAMDRAGGDGSGMVPAGARQQAVDEVLGHAGLQVGLIHASLEVVNYCWLADPRHAFPHVAISLGRIHDCMELWEAIDRVSAALVEAEGASAAPEDVVDYLAAIQVRIEEELAMIDGSTFFARLLATGTHASRPLARGGGSPRRQGRRREEDGSGGGGAGNAQGLDAVMMARFLSNLARTAMTRASVVAAALLDEHPQLQAAVPGLVQKCSSLTDVVLCEHMDLLFGQHLSVVLAGAIYYTLRTHDCAMLPFSAITRLMAARLPQHDASTFARCAVPPADEDWGLPLQEAQYCDARGWYNMVFLEAMAGYSACALFDDVDLDPNALAPPPREALEAPAEDGMGWEPPKQEQKQEQAAAAPAAQKEAGEGKAGAAAAATGGSAKGKLSGGGGLGRPGGKAGKGKQGAPRPPLAGVDGNVRRGGAKAGAAH